MLPSRVVMIGSLWDADRAGAYLHRHMFDMVLRAAYGTAMQQPRASRSLPLLLKLDRRDINAMLRRYNIGDRANDTVLAQGMAMGLGEGLHMAAPRSPEVDIFVEKTVLPRSPSIFHVVSRGVPYWNDLMRDGPADGVFPHIEDVHGFYCNTLLEARQEAGEKAAAVSQSQAR